jgi:ABC-type phosphate/phosphonate transport system ATPase subunit
LATDDVELGHEIGERLLVLASGGIAFDNPRSDIEKQAFKEKYQTLTEVQ